MVPTLAENSSVATCLLTFFKNKIASYYYITLYLLLCRNQKDYNAQVQSKEKKRKLRVQNSLGVCVPKVAWFSTKIISGGGIDYIDRELIP